MASCHLQKIDFVYSSDSSWFFPFPLPVKEKWYLWQYCHLKFIFFSGKSTLFLRPLLESLSVTTSLSPSYMSGQNEKACFVLLFLTMTNQLPVRIFISLRAAAVCSRQFQAPCWNLVAGFSISSLWLQNIVKKSCSY